MLGAAGGIGQPLSLLLKLNPRVSELALYDIRLAPGRHLHSFTNPSEVCPASETNDCPAGVAADISHINTKSKVCVTHCIRYTQ